MPSLINLTFEACFSFSWITSESKIHSLLEKQFPLDFILKAINEGSAYYLHRFLSPFDDEPEDFVEAYRRKMMELPSEKIISLHCSGYDNVYSAVTIQE